MDALFKFLEGNPLALLAFGTVLAVIVAVRYLGLWQGQNAAPKSSAASAQVAAVIVDPTALTQAAGEVAGLAVAVEQGVVALRSQTAATDRLADKIDGLESGIEKLRDQLVHVAANMK